MYKHQTPRPQKTRKNNGQNMQLNISLIEYIVPLCPLSLATILCAVAGCEIVRAACR